MTNNEQNSGNGEVMVIIDSNALIHRAYHALPPLKTKQGDLVNAVYGFVLILFRIINNFHPEYIAATFDFPAPTFRHIESPEYKAKRPKTPADLIEQIPLVKEVLAAFHIPIYEKKGFEADDLIGTIAALGSEVLDERGRVVIVSGDYDLLQLVSSRIRAYILRRGIKNAELFDESAVLKKYSGLTPSQLVDYKALRGDQSDNISGVKGIGEKTAIKIIKEYGTLDNAYRVIEDGGNMDHRIKESEIVLLSSQKDRAIESRYLSKIKCDIPMDFDVSKSKWRGYSREEVEQLLIRFEFSSLIKKLDFNEQKQKPKQPKLF